MICISFCAVVYVLNSHESFSYYHHTCLYQRTESLWQQKLISDLLTLVRKWFVYLWIGPVSLCTYVCLKKKKLKKNVYTFKQGEMHVTIK